MENLTDNEKEQIKKHFYEMIYIIGHLLKYNWIADEDLDISLKFLRYQLDDIKKILVKQMGRDGKISHKEKNDGNK